jgi:hypothetical protein
MAIAYALAGLGYWIAEDGGVVNKQVLDSERSSPASAASWCTA